jgi:Mg-chelatase subunit ChlD
MRSAPRLFALASFAAFLSTQSGWAQIKENLDLPFDALGQEEEEEEAPEIVNFYTTNLEGDGFFYVIDRSGSMQNSGELARAKSEVSKNISEFSSRVQFGIVFFDAGILKFPSSGQPAEANEAMKQAGKGWMNSVGGGSGSCCMQGILTGLQMANRAKARRKVVVYLGDGGGTCMGADENQYLAKALGTITAQNYQRVKINTIGVLEVTQVCESFLRKVAAANGGTYTRISG